MERPETETTELKDQLKTVDVDLSIAAVGEAKRIEE